MAMHAISVKELRQKFPFVQSELKKGESFLVICKSKPIGKLIPFNTNGIVSQEIFDEDAKLFEQAALEDMAKSLPPTTKEEHDYYMSLAPKSYKEKKI